LSSQTIAQKVIGYLEGLFQFQTPEGMIENSKIL